MQMYGRYTSELGQFAKDEARRIKVLDKRRRREDKLRKQELRERYSNRYIKTIKKGFSFVWQNTFARLGEVSNFRDLSYFPG